MSTPNIINFQSFESRLTQTGTLTQTNKDEIFGQLRTAYGELHSVHLIKKGEIPDNIAFSLSNIIYLFGRCVYGGKMEVPRSLFKLATAFQLVSLKLLDQSHLPSLSNCETLEQIPQLLKKESDLLPEVDRLLMETPNDQLIEKVKDKSGALPLGVLLRWMLAPEQNLEAYNKNVARFEKIFAVARGILETVKTKQSDWEIAGIIYNGERYIQSLKGDVDGALKVLEQLEPYIQGENGSIRSRVLKAQVQNITAILIGQKLKDSPSEKLSLLKQQFHHTSNAATIAAGVEEFDPFVKTLLLSNRIKLALDCLEAGESVASAEDLNLWAEVVLKDMGRENYSHYYYSQVLLNIAQLKKTQSDPVSALAHLTKANEINEKSPNHIHYSRLKEKISELKVQVQAEITDQKIGHFLGSFYPPLVDKQTNQPKYGLIFSRVVAITATAAAIAAYAKTSPLATAIVVGCITLIWERILTKAAMNTNKN